MLLGFAQIMLIQTSSMVERATSVEGKSMITGPKRDKDPI